MSSNSFSLLVNAVLISLVVAVPLVFVGQTMFPFILPKTVLFQSLAEFIIFLWLGKLVEERRWPHLTTFGKLLLVFFGWLTLSSLRGPDPLVSLWSTEDRTLGLVFLWHVGLLTLALADLKDAVRWRAAWYASLGTSAFVSLGALFAASAPLQDFFFYQNNPLRPGSTFQNPTFLAGYLLFHIFIGFWLWSKKEGNWFRWGSGLALFVDILAILKTNTRGDIAGLFAGGAIMAFLFSLRRFKFFSVRTSIIRNAWLWGIVFFIGAAGIFFFTKNARFWEYVPGAMRFRDVAIVKHDAGNRLIVWQRALEAVRERPFFGWGWENFPIAFERHYDPRLFASGEPDWDKPHNVFLEYAIAGGMPALFLYVWVLGMFFSETRRVKDGEMNVIGPAFLGAYVVRSFVFFDTVGTVMTFFLLAAFLDGRVQREEEEGAKKIVSRIRVGAWRWYGSLLLLVPIIPLSGMNWNIVRGSEQEHLGFEYARNGRFGDSLDAFESALKTSTPYRDAAVVSFANAVKEAHRSGAPYPNFEALQRKLGAELASLVQRHPENYFPFMLAAEFKNEFSEFAPSYLNEAEELGNHALSLSPRRQQIYYVLARTKILERDLPAAYRSMEQAVSLDPGAGEPHFFFGILAYETGNSKKGTEELARAEALGRVPQTVDEAVTLGNLAGDVERDYKRAARFYSQALLMRPPELNALEIRLKRGLASYWSGDREGARRDFEDAGKEVKLTTLPFYDKLKPILDNLGIGG